MRKVIGLLAVLSSYHWAMPNSILSGFNEEL